MLDNEYELYVKDVLQLTRSLSIKSVQTINTINHFIQEMGGHAEEGYEPEWKYYRNIAGQYFLAILKTVSIQGTQSAHHRWDTLVASYPTYAKTTTGQAQFKTDVMTLWTTLTGPSPLPMSVDVPMWIVSLDTQHEILFDQAVLAEHPLTLNEYKLEGRWYLELVDTYPDQIELIRSIMYPIDKALAITAKDHQILGYDAQYIDVGEDTLIMDLQAWIYRYAARWDIPAYSLSDDLYTASALAIMYLNIPPVIIDIRLRNCKSPQAHSFHIWNYLAGYSDLGRFKGKIAHGQALFLYRNIEYITKNIGTQGTLEFINEGFARPYGLDLQGFDIRQDSDALLTTFKNAITVSKVSIDSGQDKGGLYITPRSLLEKLKSYGVLNPSQIDGDTQNLIHKARQSVESSIGTGVIEVNVIDSSVRMLIDIKAERFNYWFYMAGTNKFPYTFRLDVPQQGAVITTAAEAALLLYYSAAVFQLGTTTPAPKDFPLPTFYTRGIMDNPKLTDAQILSKHESIRITQADIDWIRSTIPTKRTLVGPMQTFHDDVEAIIEAKVAHRFYVNRTNDAYTRAQSDNLVEHFYHYHPVTLSSLANYEEFFASIQLDVSALSQGEHATLVKTITDMFIGFAASDTGLTSPYYEMMEILKILSSYTVAFVPGRGTSDIRPMRWVNMHPKPMDTQLTARRSELHSTPFRLNQTDMSYGASMTRRTPSVWTHMAGLYRQAHWNSTPVQGSTGVTHNVPSRNSSTFKGPLQGPTVTVDTPWNPATLFSNHESGALYDALLSDHFTTGNATGDAGVTRVLGPIGGSVGWTSDISGNRNHWEQRNSMARPTWHPTTGLTGTGVWLDQPHTDVDITAAQSFTLWVIGRLDAINTHPIRTYLSGPIYVAGTTTEFDLDAHQTPSTPFTLHEANNRYHPVLGYSSGVGAKSASLLTGRLLTMRGHGTRLAGWARTEATFAQETAVTGTVRSPVGLKAHLMGYSVDRSTNQIRLYSPALGLNITRALTANDAPLIRELKVLGSASRAPYDVGSSGGIHVYQVGVIDRVLTTPEWTALHRRAVDYFDGQE